MSGSKTAIGVIAGVVLIAAIGGGALLYAKQDGVGKVSASAPQARSDLARFAVGPLAALNTSAATPLAPDYVFKTREGADARFGDFRGRVVVVECRN